MLNQENFIKDVRLHRRRKSTFEIESGYVEILKGILRHGGVGQHRKQMIRLMSRHRVRLFKESLNIIKPSRYDSPMAVVSGLADRLRKA